jgi:putative transposase
VTVTVTETKDVTMNAAAVHDEERGSGEPEARRLRRELFSDEMVEQLLAGVDERGVRLTGQGGFLPEMIKAVLERGMDAELTSHLGYERGDPSGRGSGNSRNGTTPKTLGTEVGEIGLDQPRDRNSTFASKVVPKGARRLGGLEDMIISLYAGGMTVRDIQYHLVSTLGTELSHETISNVTEAVTEEVTAWQNRPLEAFYPVIYLDAIVVKIRDGAHVSNKAAHIAVGVDMDGIKHVLGIWVQTSEGAKFWAGVCAQLANRGVKDVLIVCCDGLTGLPEAIEATWSGAIVQTCVVHLIRASMRFVSYNDRKAVAAMLRPIYTAPDEEAALSALATFADSTLGRKYPAAVKAWENAWERFVPFLAFGPALRKVIYTTNSIESLNYQLRKIIKNRGHFPNDAAAIKLLWLAIMTIEDKRARERAKEAGRPKGQPRKAPPRLVEGAVTQGWKAALSELALVYPDRINHHL